MATIEYSGGNFGTTARLAADTGKDLLIKAGQYGRLSADKILKPLNIFYEDVVIDGGMGATIREILDGDLGRDIETDKQRACLQINNSPAKVMIKPAHSGAQITYRNSGRGVAGWMADGIEHEGGLFYNLLGRAFGGTADNMHLNRAVVYDCVLENFQHRRGKKFGAGGGWAASVASWGRDGRPARGFAVTNSLFGATWGEAIGAFDVDGFLVQGNSFINSSHTVVVYGSSGSNVQVLDNHIFIDNRTAPRRDEWRESGGNPRLAHPIAIGKEGNDNYHAVHNWVVNGNTIIGGDTGVSLAWVENPFAFDVEIEGNLIYGQEGASVRAKNWNGLISGQGRLFNNKLGLAPELVVGQWLTGDNQILGSYAPSLPTPDTKTIRIMAEVLVNADSPIRWEMVSGAGSEV